MTLLISRIFMSLIVGGIAYYALERIWTKDIDILGFLKKPSESIPIKESTAVVNSSAIIVNPSEIGFPSSEWGITRVVEIRNTKPGVTLYSVWIKLKSITIGDDIDDIEILSEKGQEFVSESFGPATVNFDIIRFSASDADNHSCVFLLIYKLEGLESRFFKLRSNSEEAEKKSLSLSLSVGGFADKPASFFTKKNSTGFEFRPPEPIKIKSMSLLMKRTQ